MTKSEYERYKLDANVNVILLSLLQVLFITGVPLLAFLVSNSLGVRIIALFMLYGLLVSLIALYLGMKCEQYDVKLRKLGKKAEDKIET